MIFRVAPAIVSFTIGLAGCISLAEINAGMARIDRAWQLEYQKTEDEFRYRVVEADYETTFRAIRHTFLDLGMPIQARSSEHGVIVAENEAPTPLTADEWKEVARIEGPRTRELGGWFMSLSEDPKGYVVTVRATLRAFSTGTLVRLDYELDNLRLREMGVRPSKHAPPRAVQLGSRKFWSQLEKRLAEVRTPAPRRRTPQEYEI
jgi:hypothetical protein